MRIISLALHNIRSYTDCTIEFSNGITLLSGDIGAGKSTILLALEFAFFGLRALDIGGDGLLRHGTKEGSVSLTFHTTKTFTITRNLKQTSSGVRQETGTLTTEAETTDLTASELKARILQILGYPEELLSKGTNDVFRYTVYTPQESMKTIISQRAEERLSTLRSIFSVDKYQRIAQNAQLLGKELRGEVREITGEIKDTDEIQEQEQALKEELSTLSAQLEKKQLAEKELEEKKEAQQKEWMSLQEAFLKEQDRKQFMSKLQMRAEDITRNLKEIHEEQLRLEEQFSTDQAERQNPQMQLDSLLEVRQAHQAKKSTILARLQTIQEQRIELETEAADVAQLDECPVCKQPVREDHKSHIAELNAKKISDIKEKEEVLQEARGKVDSNLEKIAAKEKHIRELQKSYADYQAYLGRKQAGLQRIEQLKEKRTRLESEQQEILEKKATFVTSTFETQAFEHAQQILQKIQREYSQSAAQVAAHKATQTQLQTQLEKIQGQLQRKKEAKKRKEALAQKEHWIKESLIPIAHIIEKRVLASIHQEFSHTFTKWFSSLMADESIFATITPSFEPILTQDGYDVDFSYLSGGEKTAVALAYRLALYTVITDYIQDIQTNGVLILDEPTDGFSSEQLDRVREVLLAIPATQLIIVSHEQKMEFFVDTVIRIEKKEGRSSLH